MSRNEIDRTTDHTCAGLARDIAYFEAEGYRSYFDCVSCDQFGTSTTIPVHYVYFTMLCAACRRECTDDSDVGNQPATCVYCQEAL